jgi:hypothetical protein
MTAGAKPAAAAPVTKTVLDFGAKGDGSTDDSAAFSSALQYAAANGQMITVPAGTYAVAKTISYVSQGNAGRTWGLSCQGATIASKITGGGDVLYLQSNNTVRYFQLTGALSITGSGQDGNGIHIYAPGGSMWFYNFLITGVSVEGVGKSGLLVEGNAFESQIQNCFFQDNNDGASFANSNGGVVSAINILGCYFNQNKRYGLQTYDAQNQYGGPTDVRVYGGYCRQNGSYGFYYNNGTGGGGIEQVGFENNCTTLNPGDPNGAHVYTLVAIVMRNCTGYNEFGGATYLVRGWWMTGCTIDNCGQGAGAAMAATGKSRLIQVNGNSSGNVVIRGAGGGIDLASGSGCTWQAYNCTGPSPLGNLNPKGYLGNA